MYYVYISFYVGSVDFIYKHVPRGGRLGPLWGSISDDFGRTSGWFQKLFGLTFGDKQG